MRYRAFLTSDPSNFQYSLTYYHNPQRWNKYKIDDNNPIKNEANWSKEIKYLNDTNSGISSEIKNIPKDTGGIYYFYIKGINLPFIENYILYIGRCQYTEHQNIRKRAMEYYNDSRILIQEMFNRWKEHLYYRYFPCKENEESCQDELILISAILPQYNEDIPEKITKVAKKTAFNYETN